MSANRPAAYSTVSIPSRLPYRLSHHGFGGAGGAGAGDGGGAPPPSREPRIFNGRPACSGVLPGSGTAASFFCHGWQPSVLNALSVGSIRTTCGFLLSALSTSCLPSSPVPIRFQ